MESMNGGQKGERKWKEKERKGKKEMESSRTRIVGHPYDLGSQILLVEC